MDKTNLVHQLMSTLSLEKLHVLFVDLRQVPDEGEDVGVAEREVDLSAVKGLVVSKRGQLVEQKQLRAVAPTLLLALNVDRQVVVRHRQPRLAGVRESGKLGLVPLEYRLKSFCAQNISRSQFLVLSKTIRSQFNQTPKPSFHLSGFRLD